MIEVKRTRGNDDFRMWISGHAGYAETGKDIVCAAASILIQTLAKQLDKITPDYHVQHEKQGQIIFLSGNGKNACLASDTIMTGLRMLSDQYPHNVTITDYIVDE